ncbi:MAG: hypothetical protein P4L50_00855 [Anaerolineaceae bacterium]|nr:hypothetical protein [Anaerolineaceae bacterium]
MIHYKRPAEYLCQECKNIPLCEACKREHAAEAGHAPKSYKELALAFMRLRIRCVDGRGEELAKGLKEVVKELGDGLLREIDRFQLSCTTTVEKRKMRKLEREGRYTGLYFYAKSLLVGGVKIEAAMEELSKRLMRMLDTAPDRFKKVWDKVAADARAATLYKPILAAYNKNEVFVLKYESVNKEEKVISALKSAEIYKFKAVVISSWGSAGDRTASELASCLETRPVSAPYLEGNDISDAGAEVLARAAFSNKSLSMFGLVGNKISDTGAKTVAEAARNCHSLTVFSFCSDIISDSGAKIVAAAVKDLRLPAFGFGGIEISDVGAIAVVNVAKRFPLSIFCLSGNNISDAGARAVTDSVKDCPLSVFCLRSKIISDAGATAVAEIISSGCASTLSVLCLLDGCISDLGAKILRMRSGTVRGYQHFALKVSRYQERHWRIF